MQQRRIRRQAVCDEGRTGRWMAAAAVVGLFILAGWWLLGGQSSSRVRTIGLQKISVMVDRIDELSSAWKQRSVSDGNDSAKGGNDAKVESKPDSDARPRTAPPADSAPAAGAGNPPQPPAEPDVSREDQEQLRKLLHEINKQ